jgi:hypothetical protein
MTINRRSFLKLFAVSGCAAVGGVALAKRDQLASWCGDGQYRVKASKQRLAHMWISRPLELQNTKSKMPLRPLLMMCLKWSIFFLDTIINHPYAN